MRVVTSMLYKHLANSIITLFTTMECNVKLATALLAIPNRVAAAAAAAVTGGVHPVAINTCVERVT